jgi:AcrR family transcriptional regulator
MVKSSNNRVMTTGDIKLARSMTRGDIDYHRVGHMARWEPNANGRLAEAALELFEERGFEQTTVEDIAGRAGLTKRTFFRHFADKREVLFGGGPEFQDVFVHALAEAPATASPMEAVAVSLEAAGAALQERRPFARRRHRVISANPELQERELVKLASIAAALAAGLRDRGVEEPEASMTAEAGLAVFRVAFERWVATDDRRDLPALVRDSMDTLRAVAARG